MSLTIVMVADIRSGAEEGFESYLADEERQSHRGLLDGLDVVQRVLLVDDV